MKVRIVKRTSVVSLPLAEAFEVFSDPHTAELVMPSTMRFRVTNEVAGPIKAGTIIQYRLYFYFVPLRWRLRVESVEAPNSFVYVQQLGPFGHWRHLETFSASGDRATQVRDRFEFVPPFGRFGEFVYQALFKAKITQLFEYRANQMDRVSRGAALRPIGAAASPERAPKPQSS
jgi:ligand-binding SRPBCC domain-containing protein